jgi:hypothetical protein
MHSTGGKNGCRTPTRLNSRKQSGFMEDRITKTDQRAKSADTMHGNSRITGEIQRKRQKKANGISGQCVQTP